MKENTIEYTKDLARLQTARWKRLLHVQAPYGWNLRRLEPGFMLEVGCGVGRCLNFVGGNGVGVDTNAWSVGMCRERGFVAFTPEQFQHSEWARFGTFDSLLLAHVAEHMTRDEVVELIRSYLGYLTPLGRIILFTPQERGFAWQSDVHVEFMDFGKLESILNELGSCVERRYSFPFPRFLGRLFVYNEFVMVGTRPDRVCGLFVVEASAMELPSIVFEGDEAVVELIEDGDRLENPAVLPVPRGRGYELLTAICTSPGPADAMQLQTSV